MLKEKILYNDEMQPEMYIDEDRIYKYKVSTTENFEVYKDISKINSNNIKKIKLIDKFEKNFVYAEEYVFGRTLTNVLENEELNKYQAKKLIHELINAIELLHDKMIIHRDIKPDNIIISEIGELVLIDYNISRMYKEYQENDTTLFGTKGYAPPEQFGYSQTSFKADYYTLGRVIDLIAKKSNLNLEEVVKKCTYFDPDNRYHNINDIRKDINKYAKVKEPTENTNENNEQNSDKLVTKLVKLGWPNYSESWSIIKKALLWVDLFCIVVIASACIGVISEEANPSTIIEHILIIGYFICMVIVGGQSLRNDKWFIKYFKVFGLYIATAAIFTVFHDVFKIFS